MTLPAYRTLPVPEADALPPNDSILEKSFQNKLVELAEALGWLVHFCWDSRSSRAGLPDLLMLRNGRFIVAELKVKKRKATAKQLQFLAEFRLVASVEVYLWRPADWDTIRQVLK